MKPSIPLVLASSVALTFVTLAEAGNSALALFTSPMCIRDEVKTLRDQVACVDAQMPASPERSAFDELAAGYLAKVDAGSLDENDARQQINTALRSQAQAQASAPAAAAQQKDEFRPPKGYRRVVKKGEERFCRYNSSDLHRVDRVEICLTKDEVLAEQAGDTTAANRARQAAGETVYGSPSSNAGSPK